MDKKAVLRRRAIWATFDGSLTEEDLNQVIQRIGDEYGGDDVSSLIRYVNQVCDGYYINKAARKSLYTKLYSNLHASDADLPEDPLLRIQSSSNPEITVQQPVEETAFESIKELDKKVVEDAIPEMAASEATIQQPVEETVSESIKESDENVVEDANPEMTVFFYFMECLLVHYPSDIDDFIKEVTMGIEKDQTIAELDKGDVIGWFDAPEDYLWMVALETKTMSAFIHLFYVVLCDFLGQVDADKLYQQVLEDCKQIPAARKFNPKQFM